MSKHQKSEKIKVGLYLLLGLLLFFIKPHEGQWVLFSVRVEFFFFGMILLGIALFHKVSFYISIGGLALMLGFKILFTSHFGFVEHLFGETPFLAQLADKTARQGEWSILLNLLGLLLGFAVLARLFEESKVPEKIPQVLPSTWVGPFLLLILVYILSTFLDNIAAALIGGTVALVVFNGKVHIAYVAALVAASNAGGAGSVLGDTTTTMMWIEGVSPWDVMHAFLASFVALMVFGFFAAKQQQAHQPVQSNAKMEARHVDSKRLVLVFFILIGAIVGNVAYDMPALGLWVVLLAGALFMPLPWDEARHSLKSTFFLLGLVMSASMVPVEELPEASWQSALSLGFLSAFFDNIPLTKICLEQGHYDWGILAYAVGFGGSMVWFGSSAGVAITNKFPAARDMVKWIKNAWHIIIAYVIGFFVMYSVLGWHPSDNKHHKIDNCQAVDCPFANSAPE